MKNIYSILGLFLLLISVSAVGQTKIYAPNLTSPLDMEVNQMPDVLLDWEAVTGITLDITYEAQLATNPEFTDAVTFPRTDVTAYTMNDLLFGGKYYWRVRAYDSEEVSGWSETRSFTVIWAVSMLKPNDADDEIYANPVITWTPLSGVSSYVLEVDTTYSWIIDNSGVTSGINGIFVVSDNDSWAVGAGGLIIHNDGTGWMSMESGTTEDLNDVTFIDANNGYAVGNGGTVLNFDGSAWAVVDAGTTNDLSAVSFADADNGVVVGSGGAIVTFNTGTWTPQTTGDNNDLFDVSMLSASSIWACGKGKIVVSYNGSAWVANVVGTKDHYAIAMINDNNGWTAGKSGKIYGWDGTEWTDQSAAGVTKSLNSISFDGNNGIAVGDNGTMVTYYGAWSKATSVVNNDLMGVSILGDKGYTVGADGVIVEHTNGGFDSPDLATFNIPADSASWPLYNLFFGKTYFYRLKAIHGADVSKWSGVKSFTTYASPTLTSPANAANTDLLVKFVWELYPGTTNYIFEIDDNENFTQPRSFSPDDDTLWVSDLVFGQEYFWRVATQHALDISSWSQVRSLNTVNKITLESPENGAVEVPACPPYIWTEVMGASKYELWVDLSADFTDPIMVTTTSPNYQCQSQLLKNTVYYWKVRGTAGADVSEWSDIWSFTTEGATGIDDYVDINSINIYPNPNDGEFVLDIVSFTDDTYEIRVVDISGRLIHRSDVKCQAGQNNISIRVDNIKSGAYSLTISNDSQSVAKRLLIK